MEKLKKTRPDTHPIVLGDFGSSLLFIDIYLSILDKQDATVKELVPIPTFPGPQDLRLGYIGGPSRVVN